MKPANRRKFFEDYAESNKFDPLIAAHWYKQPISNIMAVKVHIIFYFYTYPSLYLISIF